VEGYQRAALPGSASSGLQAPLVIGGPLRLRCCREDRRRDMEKEARATAIAPGDKGAGA
jgi:hypothetical protein